MPIHITISNSLKKLADKFYNDMPKSVDIFYTDRIVTQTEGLKKWLSLYISKNSGKGIFANFEFNNPNSFFDEIFKNLDSTYEDSYLQQGNMKWTIFNLLSGDVFKKDRDFNEIFNYCGDDRVKLLRFSEKIADLFDQYFIYREEMIGSWNEDKFWGKIKNQKYREIERWQKKIFNKLKEEVTKSRGSSADKFKDRIELKKVLFKQLKNPSSKVVKMLKDIKKVSFFGLSIITTYHYELIERISEIIDCDFYLLNPSGEFWYDLQSDKNILKQMKKGKMIISTKSENDFLANYGRSGQEFYSILFKNEQALNNLDNDLFEEDFRDNLLGNLQKSIFNVSLLDKVKLDQHDKSVQISSCYTPYREIEVFYDYILGLFDKNKDLKPSDIVVLLPDIENYASYIEAIFSIKSGDKFIPFSIADKSYKGGDNPFDVIIKIIELSRGVCEAEEIMSIVENRFVSAKYGFEDFDKIREIIKEASIRWGINSDQINREGVEKFNKFNSWEFGLKRVIFGYAMQGENLVDNIIGDDILPIDIVEGSEAIDGLRLYALVKDIQDFFEDIKNSRTLTEWKEFFIEFFDKFIQLSFDEINYKQEFEKVLIYYAGDKFKVNFTVIRDDILKLFGNKKEEGGFYSGSITFCSMIPMRSIPHKVIAMIGMGENDFPGRKNKITFDLMQDKKFTGDRDTKLSNRYLFLEAVVSAKENLYLSYIGKNSKNSSTLNTSPAIDDLISYIAEISGSIDKDIKKALITEYPLFGYGKKYRNKEITTYIKDNDIFFDAKKEKKIFETKQLSSNKICNSTKSLIDFFKDSPKWYCNNILGVYYKDDDILLDGEECFDINKLVEWQINSRLLGDESSKDVIKNMQQYEGKIPVGSMGEIIVENSEDSISILEEKFLELTSGKQKNNVDISYKNIEGVLVIYEDSFVSFSVSSKPHKGKLEHFINHLFLAVSEFKGNSIFIDKQGTVTEFERLSKEDAESKIDELLEFLESNKSRVLPFDIDTAGKFMDKKENYQTIKSLNTELKSRRDGYSGEYLNRMLPNFKFDDESFEEFLDIWTMLFG